MKKSVLFLTILIMIVAGFAVTSYAEDKTVTGLGTGAIGNPDQTNGGGWSYVYYGKYTGKGDSADERAKYTPEKYRVLSKYTTDFSPETDGIKAPTMLLDCDRILFDKAFHSYYNTWADSDIKTWLNEGDTFYGNGNVFTAAERAAIAESRTEYAPDYTTANGWDYGITNIDGDHVFLLDASEAVKAAYGYVNNDSRKKNGGENSWWWLRSPDKDYSYYAGFVNEYGRIFSSYVYYKEVGVSPAFNVNLESVIFTSEITSELGSFKLTLSDNELGIKVTEGKNATRTGNVISVPYTITGSHATNATQVSVLVTDKKIVSDDGRFVPDGARIKQYGKLAVEGDLGTSGTGTFTLDTTKVTGTWGADHFIYILAEDVNGEKETDYASVPVEIAERKTISYDVTFKVKNGSWDDGTTADKKVTLSRWADEDLALQLKASQIPAVGNRPASDCKAGSWDEIPDTDKVISGDRTYTYTYLVKTGPDPGEHTVTVTAKGPGNARSSIKYAPPGKEIILYETPDAGYCFKGWKTDPASLSIKDDRFIMPDGDVFLEAVFEEDGPDPQPQRSKRELAIEAMKKGLARLGDTVSLIRKKKKHYLETPEDAVLTVVKGNKFFISEIVGRAGFDTKFKKQLSISKKGKVSAKKPYEDLRFWFDHKGAGKKVTVSFNIIEPDVEGNKKLKAQTNVGKAFDFSTTIPLNAEFGKAKNKGVAENLVFSGEAAVGEDGKLHIKGTAVKKGKITIPFKAYGKKYKAVITVKR